MNHIRETSIQAYRKIQAEGLLSRRRWEVYQVVFHHGPVTSAEGFRILNQNSPIKAITSSRARFTELRDMGLFRETGRRVCTVTGMTTIEWDVTDNLPKKLPKSTKIKCPHCDGKGFVEQGRLL